MLPVLAGVTQRNNRLDSDSVQAYITGMAASARQPNPKRPVITQPSGASPLKLHLQLHMHHPSLSRRLKDFAKLEPESPQLDYREALNGVVVRMISQIGESNLRRTVRRYVATHEDALYDAAPPLKRGNSLRVLHAAEKTLVKLISRTLGGREVEALIEYW